jgi:hypothetical protein
MVNLDLRVTWRVLKRGLGTVTGSWLKSPQASCKTPETFNIFVERAVSGGVLLGGLAVEGGIV